MKTKTIFNLGLFAWGVAFVLFGLWLGRHWSWNDCRRFGSLLVINAFMFIVLRILWHVGSYWKRKAVAQSPEARP